MESRGPDAPRTRLRSVLVDERLVEVRVRVSARARRFSLNAAPGRAVELVVPRGAGEPEIDRVLHDHRGWIGKQARRERPMSRLGLDRPGVVWIHLEPGLADPRLVDSAAVEGWYRREARDRLTAMVADEAARLGLSPGAISIRDQRTRWGSCSPRGNLSFNWRLVLAPNEVCCYVVVHELCHVRELNHSKAFWRLVDAALPGWRSERRWLTEHGHELQAYDPALAVVRGSGAPFEEWRPSLF
ncbi:MAG: SprT family zinc-dependent metalloprotease [Gaiellales bacterium]